MITPAFLETLIKKIDEDISLYKKMEPSEHSTQDKIDGYKNGGSNIKHTVTEYFADMNANGTVDYLRMLDEGQLEHCVSLGQSMLDDMRKGPMIKIWISHSEWFETWEEAHKDFIDNIDKMKFKKDRPASISIDYEYVYESDIHKYIPDYKGK